MTSAPVAESRRGARRRPGAANTLLVIGALLGGIVFAYPMAAPWVADVMQSGAVGAYEQTVAALDPQQRQRLLDDAHEYNAHLPNGPLRDPYVINESGAAVSLEEGREVYERLLLADPDEPHVPMARLIIPRIDVDLPIFHGTDDETLARGVGHLYGSGLPVGGRGVHSVLTAHSGYVNSRLFDDLPSLEIGDEFRIMVLGETLTYRVDNIATTAPDDSSLLRQVQGKDYVTLVTCTPRYVNTHRLLVRGVRVPTSESADEGESNHPVGARDPGLPWWMLIAFGPAIAVAVVVAPRRRTSAGSDASSPIT